MKRNKMMKGLLAAVLAASLVIGMAGCGGNNPKALAKEAYELSQQMIAASKDPDKLAPLWEKAKAIEEKEKKLSEAEKEIYLEEVKRLDEK
ncbi:hypothetical protein FACS1894110_24650 [Spirochaetia bacterium]|nr:hypothetical protein FACS1894110_24650 [Spirochaetia bacterium]